MACRLQWAFDIGGCDQGEGKHDFVPEVFLNLRTLLEHAPAELALLEVLQVCDDQLLPATNSTLNDPTHEEA